MVWIDTVSDPEDWQFSADDLHEHLRARMAQRGITTDEIGRALKEGWEAADARPGTLGKRIVLPYTREWGRT